MNRRTFIATVTGLLAAPFAVFRKKKPTYTIDHGPTPSADLADIIYSEYPLDIPPLIAVNPPETFHEWQTDALPPSLLRSDRILELQRRRSADMRRYLDSLS